MDPDRYCVDLAAPPGSSLHYATLWAGARERSAIIAVHALRHSLVAIIETIADSHVRAMKLNWWSSELLNARDGHPHHPVSVAMARHCTERIWHRAEVLAMFAAVAHASTEDGFASETARDEFCGHVGGGTARLCMAAAGNDAPGEVGEVGEVGEIDTLGAALERALLAGTPNARSGMQRIPTSTSESPLGLEHGDPGVGPDPIIEERTRAHRALAEAVRDMPRRTEPAVLVYRALARLRLAALAAALRKPAGGGASTASISPVRKLWIAWRASRETEHDEPVNPASRERRDGRIGPG